MYVLIAMRPTPSGQRFPTGLSFAWIAVEFIGTTETRMALLLLLLLPLERE